MIFQILNRPQKKWLSLSLALFFSLLLFLAPATTLASGTPAVYQITEQELTTLENNISTLKSINSRLQVDLTVQSQEATLLRKQLDELKKELDRLQSLSQTQESSLTNANNLLAQYATEAKRERLRIKAQRNTWEAIAACLVVALVVK